MKNNKQVESIIYSAVGVAVVLIIFLAINVIVGMAPARVDMTENKMFTLSKGTRNILSKLDTKIRIRFYVTQGQNEMPVVLKNYAQQVEDLLSEYRQASKGKIEIVKMNPTPDSDAEDSANLDGVEGQQIRSGEKIFLGLSISALDEKVALPFLPPDRDRLLEYDISRSIARVANPTKPVIGIMTSLPIWGQQVNPMMRMQGQQGQEAWVFLGELKRDFDVKKVELDVAKIDDDIKVLLVVHPKNISDQGQFAIDQFVLRGGKLIAYVDPTSVTDQSNPMSQFNRGPSGGSNLDKLFAAWGVQYDPARVVADRAYQTKIRGRDGQPEDSPTFLTLTQQAIEQGDIATSQIDSLLFVWAGAFAGEPAADLKKTVLLKSSTQAQLVDSFMATMGAQALARDYKPDGKEHALAIRLSGNFKTAFPNGKPAAAPKPPGEEGEDAPKEEPPPADTGEALKEGKAENSVILIADSDLLVDQFSVQKQNMFGQVIVQPFNGNLTLTQNISEQLAGDDNLIIMRSRASISRPFTVVREIQAKAQQDYEKSLRDLEAKVQAAQQRVNELQRKKEGGQRFILSKEQQVELAKVREEESRASKELKVVRKELRAEIDNLETKVKIANIAGMPILVCLIGVGLLFFKRKNTSAK